MLVYRVEHKKERIGPYIGGANGARGMLSRMLNERHGFDGDIDNHPAGWQDCGYKSLLGYIYGFSSIAQLQKWFDGYLSNLSFDYFIAQYNVYKSAVVLGKSGLQLTFNRKRARLVRPFNMFGEPL